MVNQFYASKTRARMNATKAGMELAIAEVNDLVQRRVEQNDAEARSTAREFRFLAIGAKELVRLLNEKDLSEATTRGGPDIVLMYRAAECLAQAVDPFLCVFEKFVQEHGPLVEEDVCQTLRQFGDLAAKLPDQLRPAWLAYVEACERDLEAAAEQEKETAAHWANVDADGLTV